MNKRFLDNITDFIFIEDTPKPADIIFVPGNGYPDMAIRAAQLWHQRYAPLILISGKYAKWTGKFETVLKEGERYFGWYDTECDFLHAVLRGEGVAKEAILGEDQSTYTYENALYARKVTDAAGLTIKTALLCCHAYHARRCQMYYQLLYPQTEFLVCPVDTGITRENWYCTKQGIEVVLGEVERCGSQFHEIIEEML